MRVFHNLHGLLHEFFQHGVAFSQLLDHGVFQGEFLLGCGFEPLIEFGLHGHLSVQSLRLCFLMFFHFLDLCFVTFFLNPQLNLKLLILVLGIVGVFEQDDGHFDCLVHRVCQGLHLLVVAIPFDLKRLD